MSALNTKIDTKLIAKEKEYDAKYLTGEALKEYATKTELNATVANSEAKLTTKIDDFKTDLNNKVSDISNRIDTVSNEVESLVSKVEEKADKFSNLAQPEKS